MTSSDLRTVNQFLAENPAFTNGGIRWLIFQASNNGLARSGALVRVRRRVYIDTEKFEKWLADQQGYDA